MWVFMTPGCDMKMGKISFWGSIQRESKRCGNINIKGTNFRAWKQLIFQVDELKVSREVWTDHNEIVNHLPVSLMQVLNNIFLSDVLDVKTLYLPGGKAASTCCLKIVITLCRHIRSRSPVDWLPAWSRSPIGFWLFDSKAMLLFLHLFHTLFVINWNMGFCALYCGQWPLKHCT